MSFIQSSPIAILSRKNQIHSTVGIAEKVGLSFSYSDFESNSNPYSASTRYMVLQQWKASWILLLFRGSSPLKTRRKREEERQPGIRSSPDASLRKRCYTGYCDSNGSSSGRNSPNSPQVDLSASSSEVSDWPRKRVGLSYSIA